MKNLPTAFQRSTLWTAITALSMTVIGAIAVGLVYLATTVLSFLQPILVPFAVAGVLAYLLEPGVKWLEKRGLGRARAVLLVFAVFSLSLGGLTWWITPQLWTQATNLTDKAPVYTKKAREAVIAFSIEVEKKYGVTLLPHEEIQKTAETAPADAKAATSEFDFDLKQFVTGEWVKTTLPTVAKNVWNFIKAGFGLFGVLGLCALDDDRAALPLLLPH